MQGNDFTTVLGTTIMRSIKLSDTNLRVFLAIVSILVAPYCAGAESNGKVHGIVKGPYGGVMSLPIEIVPDEASESQRKITVSTDQSGKYAADLAQGQYKVCARHSGLEETCRCVHIDEGRDVELDLVMRVDKAYLLPSDYDVIDRRLRLLAGKDAINCGHVHIKESPRNETACALVAHKHHKAFVVRYDVPCGDCEMSFGLAADELGRLFAVHFDSMGMSTFELGAAEVMPDGIFTVVAPCPPNQLRLTVTGALSCFSKRDKVHNIMQHLDAPELGYIKAK